MTTYAVLDGGVIVSRRHIPDWDAYPEHKKAARDEKGDGGPVLRPIVVEGEGAIEQTVIELERVRVVRSAAPITVADVVAERERRLAAGFDYDFGDARGVHRIGTTAADLAGWSEVSTYAGALIDSGDVTTTIGIMTDTGPCMVTAPEWRAIELAAAQFRQPLWAKSFGLMASNPIPADYTDDRHWA